LPFLEESKLIETKSLVHQDILEDYQNAFSSIVSRFNRQKEALEKKYHRAYNKRLKKQTALERKAWEKTKPLMSAAENQMTFEQWFAYFDNLRMAELETSMASSNNAAVLLRSFRIGRLGYWNCDNPMLQKSRFENVRILAQEATSNDYLVSALFLDFNAAFSTDKMSKIDTKGDCAYIIINGEYISWITPKEAEISDKKTIISERPFEHIRDVNIEQLRNDLLAGNF